MHSKDKEDTKTYYVLEVEEYYGKRIEPISHALMYTFFW